MSEMSNRLPVETNHVNGNERTMSRYEMMNCHDQVQYHHDSNNHSISNNLHRSHHSAAATDQIHTNNNVNECTVREQDRFMPIANVIRIMRKILPPHAKISDDAKETIQECVSEYISFITGEANERCQREQRKTITAEDVLWAMGKLGFDNYIEPLSLYLHRYRELEGDRGSLMREPFLKINRPTAMDQYARFGVRPAFHIRPPHPHPRPHPHLHPLPLPHPHPPPPPHPGYFGAPSLSSTTVRGYFKETSGTAFDDDSQHIQPPLIGSGPSSSFSATTFEPYAQQYD